MCGSAATLTYLLNKYLLDENAMVSDQDLDLLVIFTVIICASYVIEMLIRAAEAKKPAILISIHHFLSIGLLMVYMGNSDPTKVFPLESLMNYYRIAFLFGIVATYDFVGELGFIIYRIYKISHPVFVIVWLNFLIVYGTLLRASSHILFFIIFTSFVIQGKLLGPMKWVLLSIQVVFLFIEYYYVIILYILANKLKIELNKEVDKHKEEEELQMHLSRPPTMLITDGEVDYDEVCSI